MPERLDPYYQWLGIPPHQQPPDAYRLLGLRPLEANSEVIRTAAQRQMAHLRTYQLGEHSDLSQRLLNEVAAAQSRLLDPAKKAAYDRELLARQEAVSPGPVDQRAEAVPEQPATLCRLGPPRVSRYRWRRWVRPGLSAAGVVALVLIAVAIGRGLLDMLSREGLPEPEPVPAAAKDDGVLSPPSPEPLKPRIVIETKTPARQP